MEDARGWMEFVILVIFHITSTGTCILMCDYRCFLYVQVIGLFVQGGENLNFLIHPCG